MGGSVGRADKGRCCSRGGVSWVGGLRLWFRGGGGGWSGGWGGASVGGANCVGPGSHAGEGARVAGCVCVVFLAFPGVASLISSEVLGKVRLGELVGLLRGGLGVGARGGPVWV